MSGSGREALPDVLDWSGVHPGCPGSGHEDLPDICQWSGVPSGCPVVIGRPFRFTGVVGRLSWICGSGREALLDVQEWSGGPPGCPGGVGRPFRMSWSGCESLLDVQ